MANFVVGISLGIAIGFVLGFNIGIIFGKKQKSWYELTEKEKNHMKILIFAGIIILILGFLFGVWEYISF